MAKNKISKSVLGAALGGLAASWVMAQFEMLMKKAAKQPSSGQGDDATVKAAGAISRQFFHHELANEEKRWAGPVVHYAFGTVVGAVYGALAEAAPVTRSGFGAGYGSAVWFGADEIAVPALGLSGSPKKTPVGQHVQTLAAHLVYGFTTELVRWAFLKI